MGTQPKRAIGCGPVRAERCALDLSEDPMDGMTHVSAVETGGMGAGSSRQLAAEDSRVVLAALARGCR
jgi:hypothetical protein